MTNYIAFKRSMRIVIVCLVLVAIIVPTANGINISTKINNSDTVTTENVIISNPIGIRDRYWMFFIGRIDNLTVGENNFSFEMINVREFTYRRYNFLEWGFSYDHYRGGGYSISGYDFRGILRPHFICGFFHINYFLFDSL